MRCTYVQQRINARSIAWILAAAIEYGAPEAKSLILSLAERLEKLTEDEKKELSERLSHTIQFSDELGSDIRSLRTRVVEVALTILDYIISFPPKQYRIGDYHEIKYACEKGTGVDSACIRSLDLHYRKDVWMAEPIDVDKIIKYTYYSDIFHDLLRKR